MPRQGRVGLSRPALLAGLSGVLLYLAFPPADLGRLIWIALVPLLVALREAPPRRAFGLGYLTGAVAFGGILSWIRTFGLPAWLLLTAYLALFVGAFAAAYRAAAAGRGPAVGVWLAAVLWTGLEYLRSIGPTGFPWALLGLAPSDIPEAIQVARITGVFGVSFLVALANGAIASLLTDRRAPPAQAAAGAVALAIGWGALQVRAPADARMPAGMLPVAAIQPNVPDELKFDPGYAAQTMRTLDELVGRAAGAAPRLIVFPESAVPVRLFGSSGALAQVGTWAHRARATLIASSIEAGPTNTAVAVAPSGLAVDRYDKVRLVAFGEAGIRRGRRQVPLWTPEGRVGVAICFESIFPQTGRELVRQGAAVLAVITNDAIISNPSRLDGTAGLRQHAAHSVLRAVETGRWVIRAANTGRSMIVDPRGRIHARIPEGQVGVVTGSVALVDAPTPYTRWGDRFAHLVLLAAAALAWPRLGPALAQEARSPLRAELAAAVLLPAVSVGALIQAGAAERLLAAILAGFIAIASLLRPPARWGLTPSGAPAAALAGTAVVLALWWVMTSGYRAQEIVVATTAPSGGWARAAAGQLLLAAVLEAWLRGTAFAALQAWQGPLVGIAGTTLLAMLVQAGLAPEATLWALVTGAAFGLIRARTGSALGLVIPHALGNLLAASIFVVR